MLRNKSNPDAVYQSSHSIRELIRRLPQIVPVLTVKPDRVNIVEKLKELINRYQDNPGLGNSNEWISEISTLIDQSSFSHRYILGELFDKCDQAGLSTQEKERSAKNLHDIYTWFVDVSHHRTKPSVNEVSRQINRFELILEVLFKPYFEIEPEIAKLIEIQNPSVENLNSLKSLLIKRAFIEYCFRNLDNRNWLPLLKDANFFTKPIGIITHVDGAVSCPSWPQSSFLMKCAESDPDLVCKILEGVEDTDNARVHQELVEISLRLPSSMLETFAYRAKEWIKDQYHTITLLPVRLAELVAKLASENHILVALGVADTILDVKINEDKYKEQQETLSLKLPPEAEAYVDDWHYGKLLEITKSALIKVAAIDYLNIICQKLNKAIRIEHEAKGDKEAKIDYTYISRPAIEDNEQNTGTDKLKDHLISHIRDASIQVVQNNGSIDDILSCLRQFKYPVFFRIGLFILAEFPELCGKHIVAILQNNTLFPKPGIHHEFYRFLEKTFGSVDAEVQNVYYDWISSGPNLEHYKVIYEKETGVEPPPEQIKAYIGRWKLRQYSPIKSHLNGEHKIIYEDLMSKYKIEEFPEFLSYRTSWVGPTSPLNNEELNQKSVQDVIRYLKEWIPSGTHHSPSSEGLGRIFKDDVRNRAIEYTKLADSINPEGIRPVYIYYYYSGIEEAIRNNVEIDWQCIVKLSERLVKDDNLPEPDRTKDDFETGWQGVRKQVASLISEALKSPDIIPFDLRENIWNLIEILCKDGDPTIEYEAEYGGSNMSPVDMSINTVRGEAVHGLFHYLIWVDENINKEKDPKDKKHSIPEEAKPVLNRLLNTSIEPTLTIRSVIGWYIQCLAFLDLSYIQSNLTTIIPQDPELRKYRDATFEGYFSFNHSNGYLFRNLREFFTGAFDWANDSETEDSYHTPKQNYVEHLAVFYWWGIDSLTNDNCLIKRIFKNGNIKLRSHAFEFIGRSLERLSPIAKGGPEAFKRLKELLDWRLSELEVSDIEPEQKAEEMKEFGWWFTYAQMNQEWLLDTMLRVLSITNGKIEWTHEVLRHLYDFINVDSQKVAAVMDSIVRADPAPWNIEYWKEHLCQILEKIRNDKHKEAWEICKSTINFLGERGFRSFGKYLENE